MAQMHMLQMVMMHDPDSFSLGVVFLSFLRLDVCFMHALGVTEQIYAGCTPGFARMDQQAAYLSDLRHYLWGLATPLACSPHSSSFCLQQLGSARIHSCCIAMLLLWTDCTAKHIR